MLIEKFEQQVKKNPGSIAIKSGDRFYTYDELNRWANRIANLITGTCPKKNKNREPETVGLLLDHGPAMIAAVLAALKAGKVYVPISVDYPARRIAYMLSDSGASLIISGPGHEQRAKKLARELGIPCLDIEKAADTGIPGENPRRENLVHRVAYIMYTSGSTGWPKGVVQTHRNAAYYIKNWTRVFSITATDKMTLFSSFSHDGSVQDMFSALLSGAALFPVNMRNREESVKLTDFLTREQITIWHSVPSLFTFFTSTLTGSPRYKHLRFILLGGEPVREHEVKMYKKFFPYSTLANVYGQTESSVNSICLIRREDTYEKAIIGEPLDETKIFIIDEQGNEAEPLQIGEILIASSYITPGYWKNPGESGKTFAQDDEYGRLYWTGDQGRRLLDNSIEFMGRKDRQLKIRGYRVEVGEIETRLYQHKKVKEAVVMARTGEKGDTHLCAYIIPAPAGPDREPGLTVTEMRDYLSKELPDYMIPSYMVRMEKFPLTPSGKIDRQRMPGPESMRPCLGVTYAAAGTHLEKQVTQVWQEVLHIDQPGIHDNFFDLGGTSFGILELSGKLQEVLKREIPVKALFRYPTISSFAGYLEKENRQDKIDLSSSEVGKPQRKPAPMTLPLAVIGMAGRFPGAKNIRQYWENLKNGIETISFFSTRELEKEGMESQAVRDPAYVKAKGLLEEVEYFDAPFFNYSPAEARVMDPQLRILHEICWQALEDAGYNPGTYDGIIGLYAGNTPNQYWTALTYLEPGTGIDIGFLNSNYSTKVSYKLDLKGPSVIVSTACSTSLVAIHLASRGLIDRECDIALAGGISITLPAKDGYLYQEGMIQSRDGHCRAFAAAADGTVFSDGIGIVVLKRLEDAAAAGDNIAAVIKGSAINNDGSRKVGVTAPSIEGQAEVIRTAQQAAVVAPEGITYVETHGTGTFLGDTVEIAALELAFNTNKKGYCAIGSVKTNIGHLNAAAGAAGFIKTVLALKHKLIPPSLHFETPNPGIDFENGPFYVNTRLKEWKAGNKPLIAGVSSFGLGGTNAHVILEEAPSETRDKEGTRGLAPLFNAETSRKYHLILLSAQTQSALAEMTENLAGYLKENLLNRDNHENPTNPGLTLADTAYTLQVGRKAFKYRDMWVCNTITEAAAALSSAKNRKTPAVVPHNESRQVVFMFPGLGSQYVNMGWELYQAQSIFRDEMNRCFEILKDLEENRIEDILYPLHRSYRSHGSYTSHGSYITAGNEDIRDFEAAQLVVFIVEYSLARLLMSWGIHPRALIGYSFGEYTAACISGVFSPEDALKLAAARGKLISRLPAGAMLSVPLPGEEVTRHIPAELSLAIDNGPSCIVAGPPQDIMAFEKRMKERKILCFRVPGTRAIHTRDMEPTVGEFEKAAAGLTLNKPQIPFISNVTGTWIQAEEVVTPAYWGKHLQQTVQFARGMKELVKEKNTLFVEIGPGHDLALLMERYLDKGAGQRVIPLLPHPAGKLPEVYFLEKQIGKLWLYGVEPDWQQFHGNQKHARISLPTYPFARHRYWIDKRFPWKEMLALAGKFSPADPGEVNAGSLDDTGPEKYQRREMSSEYVPPRDRVEKVITRVLEQFLGIEPVGIFDDFLELGVDSLIFIKIAGRIHETLGVQIPTSVFFDAPTAAGIGQYIIKSENQGQFEPINPVEKKEFYLLSPAQERIYVAQQLQKESTAYNISTTLEIKGNLDRQRLKDCIQRLTGRHESLRTGFKWIDQHPIQLIKESVELAVEDYPGQGCRSDDPRPFTGVALAVKDFIKPFELSKAPLLRLGLIKTGSQAYLLMIDMHHIISDGVSREIMVKEFTALYKGKNLPWLRLQYKDFTGWWGSAGQREAVKSQAAYWLNVFAGKIPTLQLPLDYERPRVKNFAGSRIRFSLEKELTAKFKRLCQGTATTPFMGLLAVYYVFLHRYTLQEDIVVGTPAAGRRHPDLQYITGIFVNMLPLRNRPCAGKTFRGFLEEVKKSVRDALDNQGYQFQELVKELGINRDPAYNPLFDVTFAMQDINLEAYREHDAGAGSMSDLRVYPYEREDITTQFDINLAAAESSDIYNMVLEYSIKLFKSSTAEKMVKDYLDILHQVVEDPGIHIKDIIISHGLMTAHGGQFQEELEALEF